MVRVLAVLAAVAVTAGPAAAQEPAAPDPSVGVTAEVAAVETFAPPDPGATEYGRAFDMDESRLVVAAELDGEPVVYVHDIGPGGTLAATTTIPAPEAATDSWGRAVAVSGDTLAVSDTFRQDGDLADENYGRVHVYEHDGAAWQEVQDLQAPGQLQYLAVGVWLTGDALLVQDDVYCDGSCSGGAWRLYERGDGQPFDDTPTLLRYDAEHMRVGVDGSRIALGNPGFDDFFECFPRGDSELVVLETASQPAAVVLDESMPYEGGGCTGISDWYRRIDIVADLLAFEVCCEQRQELHIRRDAGGGYVEEAVLPVAGLSDAVATVPDVVLRFDAAAGVAGTHVDGPGGWAEGSELALPDGAVVTPLQPPVAVGARVALAGANVVHLLTVESVATCFGIPVTVDIGAGQGATSGRDIILGTPDSDVIRAGVGNDVVCAGGGNDTVDAGPGGDLVIAGEGNDVVLGRAGGDIVVGGPGRDVVHGGGDGDILLGGDGDDALFGGAGDDLVAGDGGDDLVAGGSRSDRVAGGPGADLCHGQSGTDTATSDCETVRGVP